MTTHRITPEHARHSIDELRSKGIAIPNFFFVHERKSVLDIDLFKHEACTRRTGTVSDSSGIATIVYTLPRSVLLTLADSQVPIEVDCSVAAQILSGVNSKKETVNIIINPITEWPAKDVCYIAPVPPPLDGDVLLRQGFDKFWSESPCASRGCFAWSPHGTGPRQFLFMTRAGLRWTLKWEAIARVCLDELLEYANCSATVSTGAMSESEQQRSLIFNLDRCLIRVLHDRGVLLQWYMTQKNRVLFHAVL